jgi:hypothetical protein
VPGVDDEINNPGNIVTSPQLFSLWRILIKRSRAWMIRGGNNISLCGHRRSNPGQIPPVAIVSVRNNQERMCSGNGGASGFTITPTKAGLLPVFTALPSEEAGYHTVTFRVSDFGSDNFI